MLSINKLVNDFATLQKDEQQLEKERIREIESEAASLAADVLDDASLDVKYPIGSNAHRPSDLETALPNTPVSLEGTENSNKETEKLLARKLKQISVLEERLQVAEKFKQRHSTAVAEQERLRDRSEELQMQNEVWHLSAPLPLLGSSFRLHPAEAQYGCS